VKVSTLQETRQWLILTQVQITKTKGNDITDVFCYTLPWRRMVTVLVNTKQSSPYTV